MYLRIKYPLDKEYLVRIEDKHLNNVRWALRDGITLCFGGIGLEEEGKSICDRLSKLKKGDIVEVEVETQNYKRSEGICEVDEIRFPHPDVDKAPAIYRFFGYLKRVE